MSDNLIERLRNLGDRASFKSFAYHEAADCIEHLEAKLQEARMSELAALGQAQEAYERQMKAEAKVKRLQEQVTVLREAVDDLYDCANAGLRYSMWEGPSPKEILDRALAAYSNATENNQ